MLYYSILPHVTIFMSPAYITQAPPHVNLILFQVNPSQTLISPLSQRPTCQPHNIPRHPHVKIPHVTRRVGAWGEARPTNPREIKFNTYLYLFR